MEKKSVLVVGATGMLGQDVVAELKSRDYDVSLPSHSTFDITDPLSVAKLPVGDLGQFSWCINCAAYTAVDRAETDEENATLLNALGPGYLAQACRISSTKLLHVSTDFVFDGTKDVAYVESDVPNPLNVYGKTKLAGERAAIHANPWTYVCRTSWLYGSGSDCFPGKLIKAWLAGKPLRVVEDQVGNPTSTIELAKVIASLMESDAEPGIFHTAGLESMSWRDFAEAAIRTYAKSRRLSDRPIVVEGIFTSEWPTPAVRPKFSGLSSQRLPVDVKPMRAFPMALEEYVERLTETPA